MQWSKWSYAGTLCIALVVSSSAAYGQTNEAKAEELFNKAVELSEAHKYTEACPLLAESQKLDPRASTLYALADCEGEAGKIASAVLRFKEYVTAYEAMKGDARKRHDQRANSARGYIKSLEPQAPKLKLTIPAGIPSAFVLTRNGEQIDRIGLDKDLLVDPGEQVIVFQVPGHQDAEQRVSLALKESKVVELVAGVVAETSDQPGAGDGSKRNVRRTAGFVMLGAGVVGLAFGGAMGGLAVGQKDIVTEHCKGLGCDPMGLDAAKQGRSFGNLSTVGFVAGGVLAATGLVLVVTAPKAKPNTAWITGIGATAYLGGPFLSVEGRF